jgi:nicotinic acid phosphoribosyltransferase
MSPAQRQMVEGILFGDACQLSMAHIIFRMGMHEKLVQFDHYLRSTPGCDTDESGFCNNAGLEWLLGWMRIARFRNEEIIFPPRQENLDRLQSGIKRLIQAHFYHVSLTERLWQLKQSLVDPARRACS